MTDDTPPARLTDGGRTTPTSDAAADDAAPIGRQAMLGLLSAGVAGAVAGCLGGDGDGDGGADTADGEADDGDGQTDASDGDEDGTDGSDGDADDASDDDGEGADGSDGTDDGETDGGESGRGATGPVHALPFEDDLDELAAVHESADLDRLWLDTENTDQFARRDGADEETDDSRVNRADADPVALVYQFEEPIEELRAEAHFHNEEGGEIAVAVSSDGEEWTDLDVERTLYSEAHNDEEAPGHWWANYEYIAEAIDGDVTAVRFTLDGDVSWSPQLGWVEVR